MSGSKLRTKKFSTLFNFNCVLLVLVCLLTVKAAEFESSDYDYDYYNEYEPLLYDGVEYVDTDANAEEDYYNDARSKKELTLDDLEWMNRTIASLAEPRDCGECTTKCCTTTTKCCTTKCTTPCPTTPPCTTPCPPTCCPTPCPPKCSKPKCPGAKKSSLSTAIVDSFRSSPVSNEQDEKAKALRNMVQRLYIAQARVQLEASEIKKAQAIANEAQQQLEESANHVRAITAALQNAQQEVASSAIRAQTAQLQLAAHDQLLFAARQDVDCLSSQMVGLQAAEGIAQPKASFDICALMEKLKQPLLDCEKPTAIPPLDCRPKGKRKKKQASAEYYYDDEDVQY